MVIQCPRCNQVLHDAEQYSGQTVACPFCNEQFQVGVAVAPVPFAAPMPPPLAAHQQTELASSATLERFRRRKKTAPLAFLGFLVVAIVLGGVAAVSYLRPTDWKLPQTDKRKTVTGANKLPANVDQLRQVILKHLDSTENKYKIDKWYDPVTLAGASWVQNVYPGDRLSHEFKVQGFAVRLEYRTDEGFEQWAQRDRIFCIGPDGKLIFFSQLRQPFIDEPSLAVRDFYVGKPGGRGDAPMNIDKLNKEVSDFLSP